MDLHFPFKIYKIKTLKNVVPTIKELQYENAVYRFNKLNKAVKFKYKIEDFNDINRINNVNKTIKKSIKKFKNSIGYFTGEMGGLAKLINEIYDGLLEQYENKVEIAIKGSQKYVDNIYAGKLEEEVVHRYLDNFRNQLINKYRNGDYTIPQIREQIKTELNGLQYKLERVDTFLSEVLDYILL